MQPGSGKNQVVNRRAQGGGQAGTAGLTRSHEGFLPLSPSSLPTPPSRSHQHPARELPFSLRGAFKGSDPEGGSSWKPQLPFGSQHPTRSPAAWELQQPAAPPGEALGSRQLEDKGNTHTRENPGAKAAGDCLKTGARAGCILWTLAGFLQEEGG